MKENILLEPCGDQCVIVEFSKILSIDVNQKVCAFANHLREAALPYIVDIVPALSSVGVHYQAQAVPTLSGETPYIAIKRCILEMLDSASFDIIDSTEIISIPVCYGGEYGPDLESVASTCNIDAQELIRTHTETIGQVLMVCFAPGHSQMGLWDERISVPRRATPRTKVAAGSVAIANRQTVVYPFDLPGGWNIIGRTPKALFDLSRTPPCLLKPGIRVRFEAISETEFLSFQQEIP